MVCSCPTELIRIDKTDYDRIKFADPGMSLKMKPPALVIAVESVMRHPEEDETQEHRYHRIQLTQQICSHLPLFEKMSEARKTTLIELMDLQLVRRHNFFYKKGDASNFVGILISGGWVSE